MTYGFYGADDVPQFESCAVQALWMAADVRDVFVGIAASRSNALRAGADTGSTAGGSNHLVAGKMGVRRALHRVEWRWIGLHFVVAVVSVGFVVWTVGVLWRMRGRVCPAPQQQPKVTPSNRPCQDRFSSARRNKRSKIYEP